MNTLCTWDRLEANISRMFRICKSHFTTQTVVYHVLKWCWITARQRNKSAPYKVKSRHYKWRLLWQNIFFKKNYQFLKCARAYLRKGHYVPETQQQTEPTYGIDAGISPGPHWWEASALTTVYQIPISN